VLQVRARERTGTAGARGVRLPRLVLIIRRKGAGHKGATKRFPGVNVQFLAGQLRNDGSVQLLAPIPKAGRRTRTSCRQTACYCLCRMVLHAAFSWRSTKNPPLAA
jgi:hypothetical protein